MGTRTRFRVCSRNGQKEEVMNGHRAQIVGSERLVIDDDRIRPSTAMA
jgi:hypothetical protein